jgi:signal transduction histidine kinase
MKISGSFILCLVALCLCYAACRNNHSSLVQPQDVKTKIFLDSVNKLVKLSDSTHIINNSLSKKFAFRALALATHLKSPKALAIANKAIGGVYLNEQNDSSFIYYSRALKIAERGNYKETMIRSMYCLARLYSKAYDFKPAVLLLDSVIYFAKQEKDYTSISDALNALAAVQIELHDSAYGKRLVAEAIEIAKEHKLVREQGTALGNLSFYQPNLQKSLAISRQALNLLQETAGAEEERASLLLNIGIFQQDPDSTLFYSEKALNIVRAENLQSLEFPAYYSIARSYLAKGDLYQAERYLLDYAIPLAKKQNNVGWLAITYDLYADELARKDQYKVALDNERLALATQRQVDAGKAIEQSRLLTSILDLKNKETEIADKENDIRNQRTRIQTITLLLVICVLILIGALLIIVWLRQQTRFKIQEEQIRSARKIIEIEEREKGRLSRELHDTIGHLVQGLTGHIDSLQFQDEKINQEVSGKLKELGQSIRSISHRMSQVATEKFSFYELITGLCEDVKSLTGLKIKYSIPNFPFSFTEELNLHMYRIVQELLTNANKYASDASIQLTFALLDNKLHLIYIDNGPGFETGNPDPHFFGLSNILERVKLLGGNAKLESSPGKGTTWEISIPILKYYKI